MTQETHPKNNELRGWHKTYIRIRYKDTDRLGVVYYGNYLTYFEVGRAEFMRSLGVPYSWMEKQGYTLVVIEACAKYHGNVGYDDLICVNTAVTEIRKVRVKFNYRVTDQAGKLLVTGHTVHACLDANQKPTRIPQRVSNILKDQKLDL